jgi:cytochrome b
MNPPRTVGHNPLGGWMILLLLGSLVGLVLSGLFAADDEVAGPLAVYATPGIAHTLAELHEGMAVFLLVLIAIHVAGVLVDSLLTGDNLIRAMLTGRKHVMSDETGADAEQKSPRVPAWRAVVALATATGLTWLVTTI